MLRVGWLVSAGRLVPPEGFTPCTYVWCNLLLAVCRMETLARISAQNERKNQKTIKHKVEMQERERVLSRDTKMKSFMLIKCVDRSKLEEEAKKRKGTG